MLALGEPDLHLPLVTALSQVYAFMGRRGSGKTYGAGRLVELLIMAGGQDVIIDPVGVWWGVRFMKDGKTPSGLHVPVFGGWHGDMPLPSTSGKVFAELVAAHSTSMVLDVSDMTGAEQRRFVAEFCAELFHAKKRSRSPVLVVFEEAQEFVPQHVRGEVAKMVGSVERLIKLGRNYGVGAALISQRPQAVNKDVLNQAEVMLAFQLTGPQERKAIAGWVQETGAGDRAIADDLPALPVGTAMVWSPQWLQKFGKFKIGKKDTYDASATPDGRADESRRKLPPIDLEAVRGALKSVEAELADNDVHALKAEIRKLRAAARATPYPQPKPERVEVEVVPARVFRQLEAFEAKAVKISRDLERVIEEAATIQAASNGLRKELDATRGVIKTSTAPNGAPAARQTIGDWPKPGPVEGVATDIGKGPFTMLRALATRHPKPLSKKQLATLSGYAVKGRTFRDYVYRLNAGGYITRAGEDVALTELGLTTAGGPVPPKSPHELVAMWKSELTGKAKDILELLAAEPRTWGREEIGGHRTIQLDPGAARSAITSTGSKPTISSGRPPEGSSLTRNSRFERRPSHALQQTSPAPHGLRVRRVGAIQRGVPRRQVRRVRAPDERARHRSGQRHRACRRSRDGLRAHPRHRRVSPPGAASRGRAARGAVFRGVAAPGEGPRGGGVTILDAIGKCLEEGGWMRPKSTPDDPSGWVRPTMVVNQWVEPNGERRRHLDVSPDDILGDWEWRP
jgi:hypothetical protein